MDNIIYWDTCVFISYITGQNRTPLEISAMDYIVSEIEANKAILVTSVVTIVETLYDLYEEAHRTKFTDLFDRPNVRKIEVTYPIAYKANEIRSNFKNIGITRLRTADAIHLATAIWARVPEFHTFDGSGDQPGLLGFNGHDILGGLRIVVPPPPKQPSLF